MKKLQIILGVGALVVGSTTLLSMVKVHRDYKARKAQREVLLLWIELWIEVEQERLYAELKPVVDKGIDDMEDWLYNIS